MCVDICNRALLSLMMPLHLSIAPTAPPLNIKARPMSSQIIEVSWSLPPRSHHHGLIKGYKVKYSEKFSTKKKEKVVRNVHFAELTNLQKYTEYSIAVLAFTDGGDGKLSDNIIARTLEDGMHMFLVIVLLKQVKS